MPCGSQPRRAIVSAAAMMLAALAACNVPWTREPSPAEKARRDLTILASGAASYGRDFGYPPLARDIDAFIAQIEPTYTYAAPRSDPWGNLYNYDFDNRDFTFRIWSLGPDGKPSPPEGLHDEILSDNGRLVCGPALSDGRVILGRLIPEGVRSFYVAASLLFLVTAIGGTSLWAGFDAARLLRRVPAAAVRENLGRPRSAGGWTAGCLLCWLVYFPLYLRRRTLYRRARAWSGESPTVRGPASPARPRSVSPAGGCGSGESPTAAFWLGFKLAFGFWIGSILVAFMIGGIALLLRVLEGWGGLPAR